MNQQQLESAARELCRLRNINPDTLIPHSPEPSSDGFVPAVLLHSPAWKLALHEIQNHYLLNQAINHGMQTP